MSNSPITPELSFVAALGIELSVVDGRTHGHVELDPAMWAPGTTVPRLGLLATFVDFVGGFPPGGALNPTVDIRTTLLRRPPSTGTVHLVGHTLKHGRRLYVAEVLVDDGRDVFASATTTFVADPPLHTGPPVAGRFGQTMRPLPFASFDELLGIRHPDERTTEMDAAAHITNGAAGTIQGGAQATFAEVAAEWALRPEGAFTTVDLDIRYLNRVTAGPVVAVPEVVGRTGDDAIVRVAVTDRAAERVASFVMVTCRRSEG